MQFSDIELKIKNVIESIPNQAREEGWEWTRGTWTKLIKKNLIDIADEYKWLVAAHGCDGVDQGEWLYDMVWYEKNDRYITKVPLVLESELNSSDYEIDDDFYKLLIARADCRVWVFERKTRQQVQDSFSSCIEAIKQFSHSQKGDRYLMLGVDWNPREFQSRLYVHMSS
jgi:hypothetical protein